MDFAVISLLVTLAAPFGIEAMKAQGSQRWPYAGLCALLLLAALGWQWIAKASPVVGDFVSEIAADPMAWFIAAVILSVALHHWWSRRSITSKEPKPSVLPGAGPVPALQLADDSGSEIERLKAKLDGAVEAQKEFVPRDEFLLMHGFLDALRGEIDAHGTREGRAAEKQAKTAVDFASLALEQTGQLIGTTQALEERTASHREMLKAIASIALLEQTLPDLDETLTTLQEQFKAASLAERSGTGQVPESGPAGRFAEASGYCFQAMRVLSDIVEQVTGKSIDTESTPQYARNQFRPVAGDENFEDLNLKQEYRHLHERATRVIREGQNARKDVLAKISRAEGTIREFARGA